MAEPRELAELLAQTIQELADARGQAAAHRAVAVAAVHHAHNQHVELTRLRAQLAALRDELRRYTATAVAGQRAA